MSADTDEALPQLQRALLDRETLDQLFFDLGAATELREIVLKGASTLHADDMRKPTLDDARHLLLSRQVIGVQLRYRYGGSEWWDTLLHTPEGVELVRIARPF